MITILISIALILYIAIELQDRLRIPTPLSLIFLSFVLHLVAKQVPLITGNPEQFSRLVLLLLPILLIADSLELEIKDLKQHGLSLFYLAVVAVTLSVIIAIPTAKYLFTDYNLTIPEVILLFSMVLATDPVSVVSIFSSFNLPKQLKILAEGESLFNDATALIVFVFIGLYALGGGTISITYLTQTTLFVIIGSTILGITLGLGALALMKLTTNRISELLLLILSGYTAFQVAEKFYLIINAFGGHSHMHFSGILACIFATITVNHVLCKEITLENNVIKQETANIEQEADLVKTSLRVIRKSISRLLSNVEERERHRRSKEDVLLLALVANTILFVSLAEIINLELLWYYRNVILIMFIATTVIRAAMMAKFAYITNQTTRMTNINYRWWAILTFAGIKGGLSIVMLSMIPADFRYLETFRAVVIGVILLSTFIYSGVLLALITLYKEEFRAETSHELA